MNIKRKKTFYTLLLTCLAIQNIHTSSSSWSEAFYSAPSTVYNWAQENRGKTLVGGLAGLILAYACYQRYTDYCAINSKDTFLEALSIDDHTKQTITELFAPYRNRKFINTQNELIKNIKNIGNDDYNNPLFTFKNLFHYNQIPEEYKHLFPSIVSTFYFYTLLASQGLIDTKSMLYDPAKQNMFYVHRGLSPFTITLKDLSLSQNGKKYFPFNLLDQKKYFPYNYKIHLMPTKKEFIPVLLHLMQLLKSNQFSRLMGNVKIDPTYILDYDKRIKKDSKNVVAGIIIYEPLQKDSAQRVLDLTYQNFKQFNGNGVRPRFNGQVTNLIYIAQGDADEKLKEENREWFEQPDMIYYNLTTIKPGSKKNFHLNYPDTNIEITEPIRPVDMYLK